MKPEEQRIAIAEACGAKWMNRWSASHATLTFMKEGKGSSNPDWSFCHKDKEVPMDDTIPDYLNDLNAMHEAETVMTDQQRTSYLDKLYEVCNPHSMLNDDWNLTCATAAQRAKAFLKTIGKWKETCNLNPAT